MRLNLKSLYKQKIVPSLIEEFGYKNIEQVPKLVKISVNRGVGEASKNSNTVIENFDVRTPGNNTLALALSGGNQQKFVVGREIENKPSLLIASQPTRGIDIGAQSLIWNKLRDARDDGLGVLLISADLDELIGLSDRIYVIYEGSFVKELDPENATPEILGSYMTGLKT